MKYLLLLFFFTFTIACTKQVDYLLPDTENRIVVNSIITSDSVLTCSVLYATGIQKIDSAIHVNSTLKNVAVNLHYDSTAIVKIYKDNTIYDSLDYVGDGLYQGHLLPLAGHGYQLVVVAEGNTLTATTTIPKPTLLDSVVLINNWRPVLKDNFIRKIDGKLITYFRDDASNANYYDQTMCVWQQGIYSNAQLDSINNVYPVGSWDGLHYLPLFDNTGVSDFIINEGTMAYNPSTALYSDKTFNGQAISTYIIGPHSNTTSNVIYGDSTSWFTLLRSTSYEYYTYQKAYLRNISTSIGTNNEGTDKIHNLLFPPTPYPAYSNIVGKGVGIFAGYSSSIKQARIIYN